MIVTLHMERDLFVEKNSETQVFNIGFIANGIGIVCHNAFFNTWKYNYFSWGGL